MKKTTGRLLKTRATIGLDVAKAISRLRELWEAARISQRELARLIDQDFSNVNFWERSGKLPRADKLVPVAKALGVTVPDLLGEPRSVRARPLLDALRCSAALLHGRAKGGLRVKSIFPDGLLAGKMRAAVALCKRLNTAPEFQFLRSWVANDAGGAAAKC